MSSHVQLDPPLHCCSKQLSIASFNGKHVVIVHLEGPFHPRTARTNYLASGRLRLRPCICVCIRASASASVLLHLRPCVCVCVRASPCPSARLRVRPCSCVSVCPSVCPSVRLQVGPCEPCVCGSGTNIYICDRPCDRQN